jgi:hypothetical protein
MRKSKGERVIENNQDRIYIYIYSVCVYKVGYYSKLTHFADKAAARNNNQLLIELATPGSNYAKH